MTLKILIAGCAKDERDRIESSVKDAFGGRAENDPWNISLVNIANQWSIEIDGPQPPFKGLSFVAAAEDLAASVRRALNAASAEAASESAAHATDAVPSQAPATAPPPPPEPVVAPVPAATAAVPVPAPSTAFDSDLSNPVFEAEALPELVALPSPSPNAPPAPAPSPATAPPAAAPPPLAAVDGERTDRHQCEGCAAAFDVFYYSVAGERIEMCPVACPACWHVNSVPIAAGAGLNGDYRAQAAG